MTGGMRARVAVILMAMAGAAPAWAHPHVWVTMRSDVVFGAGGLLTGINVQWTFDDAYAQYALDGLDANGDGVYAQDELAPLTRSNLEVLRDYDYFAAIRFNGEKQAIADATDYGQIWSAGKLQLYFHVPLKQPIDPLGGEVVVKVYDPDFFVDFQYEADDPVAVIGGMPKGCGFELRPVPTTAELEQTRTMLSTKGRDWQPENNEDFGALFAQPAIVTC
jgi:ABC-type uncharacterized transport system substrate-binding protein